MREPWILDRRKSKKSRVWAVRFWDFENKKYYKTKTLGIPITGKSGGEQKARKKAEEIYRKLVEQKQEESIPMLIPFVESYWQKDSSYILQKNNRKETPIDSSYIKNNYRQIKKHASAYNEFDFLKLTELKLKNIEKWQDWAIERGGTPSAINDVMEAMRVAFRDWLRHEEISYDPFKGVKKIPEFPKEKGILKVSEVNQLYKHVDTSPRIDFLMKVATLLGLRRGEIRGLKWGDIDFDKKVIYIQHNYVEGDGMKPPKYDSYRSLPLQPGLFEPLATLRRTTPYEITKDAFVLYNENNKNIPMCISSINKGFERFLKAIGIPNSKKKERNITLHGLRHTFVTHAQESGLSLMEVGVLAGHKDMKMTLHYTHPKAIADVHRMGAVLNEQNANRYPDRERVSNETVSINQNEESGYIFTVE